MLEKLFKNLHWFIIFYTAFNVYNFWEEHVQQKEMVVQQIPTLQRNIREANREKNQLEEYVKDIDEARTRVELVAQEVERIQQQLPSEISDTENLSLIRNTAESLHIRNISLSPEAEQSNGFYFVKPYTFSARGTFLQFLIFFERIGESTRLFNIRELRFQRASDEQRGRFQIIEVSALIEAYRYNQNHKESRDIGDIQKEIEREQSKGKEEEPIGINATRRIQRN